MGHNNTEKDKGPGFKPGPLRPNIARRDQDSRAKPAQARGRLAGKDNMRLWNESLLKRSIGSAFQTSRRPRGKTVRRRFAARVFRRCAARAREKDNPAAIAELNVQPVPCVFGLTIRSPSIQMLFPFS